MCVLLKAHFNTHGGDYQCSFCGGTFLQLSSLRFHERQVHGQSDAHNCGVCGRIFSSIVQMKEHLKHEHRILVTKTITVYGDEFVNDDCDD